MRRVVISRRAARDIQAIGDYIEGRSGAATADRVVASIHAGILDSRNIRALAIPKLTSTIQIIVSGLYSAT